MLQLRESIHSAPSFPVEERWIKEWFKAVLHDHECYGITTLSEFRNYEINYEFEQPKNYTNRVVFHDDDRHVTLIAQKITIEYITTKRFFNGLPTIRIIRKSKVRKPLLIHG